MKLIFGGQEFITGVSKPVNVMCVGKAGAGKTVLAQYIVDCLPRCAPCACLDFAGKRDIEHLDWIRDTSMADPVYVFEELCTAREHSYPSAFHNKDIPTLVIVEELPVITDEIRQAIKKCNDANIWFMFLTNSQQIAYLSVLEELCDCAVYMSGSRNVSTVMVGSDRAMKLHTGHMLVKHRDGSIHEVALRRDSSKYEMRDYSIALIE